MSPILQGWKYCCLPWLLAVALAAHAAPAAAEEKASATAPGAGKAPPEDRSLPADAYPRLKMPIHIRVWTGDEMGQASQALVEIAKTNPVKLPRYRSKLSGDVFARMTANENFDYYRNKSMPLNVRFPGALKSLEASNEMTKLYIDSYLKKATGSDELIELTGAQIRASAVLEELVEEFIPTIPKTDPSYEQRLKGAEQMKQGLATSVLGALQMLTEREMYSPGERIRLIGYLKESVPLMAPRLLPASQKETLARLDNLVKDENLKDLQPSLGELQAAIGNSLKAEPKK